MRKDKFLTFFSIFCAFVALCCVGSVAAGSIAEVSADSAGVVGVLLTKASENISNPLVAALVGLLVSAFLALVGRLLRWVLTQIQTKWKWTNNKLVVGWFWKMAAFLFGNSVLMYKAVVDVDDKEDEILAKEALKKKVEEHFKKHYGEAEKYVNELSSK